MEEKMKTKRLNQRMILNKTTISNLNTSEMNQILGGGTRDTDLCLSKTNPSCTSWWSACQSLFATCEFTDTCF